MAERIPQGLEEIIGKGFPEPSFNDVVKPGLAQYIKQGDSVMNHLTDEASLESSGVTVGYCFDGSFLPIRNGASSTLFNLMRAVSPHRPISPVLFNCYRGWDDPKDYSNQMFGSVLLHPEDYYKSTLFESVSRALGAVAFQLYSPEGVLNLAPKIKQADARVILELQNTDHVLLERLGAPQREVSQAKQLEREALTMTDFVFCRSDVDQEYAIELGAPRETTYTYRGGIHVSDFDFVPRDPTGKRLVYLGHMYYEPNVNAVRHLARTVLPELDESYSITVLGITPQSVVDEFKGTRITFKQGIDDLNHELQEYDIALAPLTEGSGTRLKVLDYLASGLPVITTTLGIEGLESDIAQHLFVEDNLAKYGQIIQDIPLQPDRALTKAEQGRAFVEDRYDWEQCVKPFIELYLSLHHS